MKERSKTNKEIYEQKYPFEELSQDPMICAKALGYLEALTTYFPSEQEWVDSKKLELLAILLFYSL